MLFLSSSPAVCFSSFFSCLLMSFFLCPIQFFPHTNSLLLSRKYPLFLNPDEPVWAIGTGLVCPSNVAQEVHIAQASNTRLSVSSFRLVASLNNKAVNWIAMGIHLFESSFFLSLSFLHLLICIFSSSSGPCLYSLRYCQKIRTWNR